jgi:hypothetical protein
MFGWKTNRPDLLRLLYFRNNLWSQALPAQPDREIQPGPFDLFLDLLEHIVNPLGFYFPCPVFPVSFLGFLGPQFFDVMAFDLVKGGQDQFHEDCPFSQ